MQSPPCVRLSVRYAISSLTVGRNSTKCGVWVTHMNKACNSIFFGPTPWGPGEGSKGQISFNFNYKVNFKDFYTKLCVCSHKWKIRNISDGILILMPGSCPLGGTLGRWGCRGGQKKIFQTLSCGISNRLGWRAEQNASKIFILGSNWWPWGEVKRSNIIISINMSISKILYQTICVLYKWKIQNLSDGIFILSPWSCPRVGILGRWGCPGGSKNIFFKHGHMAYQINGDDKQNKLQVKFSS